MKKWLQIGWGIIVICAGNQLAFPEDFSTTNRETLGNFWQAAEEKQRPVTVLSFGDSMADSYRSPTFYLMKKLEARLGTAGYSLVNYDNKTMYQLIGATTYLATTPVWFSTYFSIPAGSGVWWESLSPAGGVISDEVGIFYVRHPQGGLLALSISTNSGPWATNLVLDGFSATPMGCFTNVNLPLNRYRLRVDGISGTNFVIGPHLLQAHTNGLHVVFADYAGIALPNVMAVPASIREPIFAALRPDLLVWHMKEPIEPLRSGMEACETWWTNAWPKCDVLYIGTPNAIQDLTEPATATTNQNRIVREVAVSHRRGYVDMMQPGESYAALTASGLLSSDGVHLTAAGGQWGAEIMWRDMNLFALGLPRSLNLQSAGTSLNVTFDAKSVANYELQSSSNLVNWSSVFTVNGEGRFRASIPTTASGRQFFRLNLTPN